MKQFHATMQPVNSSLLTSIGHDPNTNTLVIFFPRKGGGVSAYHYPNFSAAQFASFLSAESAGKFFLANVKNNPLHPHTKIGD